MKRVLKKDGKMILTMNNKHNINFYSVLRLGVFFRLISYPVEFYTSEEMEKFIDKAGFVIKNKTTIVHLMSPLNKALLYLRFVLGTYFVSVIARYLIRLAKFLGKKKTKIFTGWFMAFLITKKDNL